MILGKTSLPLAPSRAFTSPKAARCLAPKTPALKPGPPRFKAIVPVRGRLHSNVVMPGKGAFRRGKRGPVKAKEGHERTRLSNSLVLKRVRKILEGNMSPAQALAVIFFSPSVLLNGSPAGASASLASSQAMIEAAADGFLLAHR